MPFSHTLVLKTYVADTLMSLFAFGQKPVTEYFLSIKIRLSLILGMAVLYLQDRSIQLDSQ